MAMNTDVKGLIGRVKGILLSPSTEWPIIAAEPATPSSIYLQYVAPLVAIGVIAGFIGQSVIGFSVPFLGHVRMPVVGGLVTAIMTFLLAFVGVWLISLLVDALAPTFGGQKDPLRALKVTVYSYTPGWVAAILHIIPALGIIGILASLYGLYLLYLGLPVLMRCPKEKSLGYTIVLVICAIVMWIVIGSISTLVVGGLGFGAMGAAGALTSVEAEARERAAGENVAGALSNVFGGKSDADKARVNDALQKLAKIGEQTEQTEKTARAGGTANSSTTGNVDMNAALGAVGQIMSGGKDVQPVDFRRLKEMLPDSLPGMKRESAEGQSGEAMGMKGSSAIARYGNEAGGRVTVEIADIGSLAGLASLAARFDPKMEKETDSGYERTFKVNGQIMHERYDRRARSGEVSILAADRFSIIVNGSNVEADALTGALKRVDLTRFASLASAAR